MSGRCRPSAEANPAICPLASRVGVSWDGEDGARRAEADDDVAGLQAETERRAHVVARARPDDEARVGDAGGLGGAEDARDAELAAQGETLDAGVVLAGDG